MSIEPKSGLGLLQDLDADLGDAETDGREHHEANRGNQDRGAAKLPRR